MNLYLQIRVIDNSKINLIFQIGRARVHQVTRVGVNAHLHIAVAQRGLPRQLHIGGDIGLLLGHILLAGLDILLDALHLGQLLGHALFDDLCRRIAGGFSGIGSAFCTRGCARAGALGSGPRTFRCACLFRGRAGRLPRLRGGCSSRCSAFLCRRGRPGSGSGLLRGFFGSLGNTIGILGGSRIAQYLAWVLTDIGTHVTIVEKDEAKCLMLAEKLPKVTVIHGDGTNHDLLESEGIFHCDAFIAVTDRDEENLLMALTAKRYGVKKVVPKMSRMGYLDIVNLTGLDTVISPKAIIASQISSYVRGLANSQGSAVESLHYILGGAIEAVEFTATSATHFLDRPLSDLHFRNGLLVAAIVHNGRMEIPNGHSQIHAGDRVIVVAKKLFLQDLNDILG